METEHPLLYQPFADVPALNELREELYINVPENERFCSLLGGVAAIAAGVSRWSGSGTLLALAGVALVFRGLTGHCAVYDAMGKRPVGHEHHAPSELGIGTTEPSPRPEQSTT